MQNQFNLQKQEHYKSKYIVFIDLDGTFLDSHKHVPKENLDVLDYADKNNILIVPTTGRSLMGIPTTVLFHQSVKYAICSNGATIYDLSTGNILSHNGLTKENVLFIYQNIKHLNIQFDIFADNYIYAQKERMKNISQFHLDQPTLDYVHETRTLYDDTVEELLGRVERIDRLNIFYNNKNDYDYIMGVLNKLPQLIISSSLATNIEVNSQNAHKGQAIIDLMTILKIPIEKSIAFGDGNNDLTMLKNAHDGVAMLNAIPECQKIANHITASCDDAGVGKYLMKVWKKEEING